MKDGVADDSEKQSKADLWEEHKEDAEKLVKAVGEYCNADGFDSATADDQQMLYDWVIGDMSRNFTETLEEIYPSLGLQFSDVEGIDPRARFLYATGYSFVDADQADRVLKTIFNITPKRSVEPWPQDSYTGEYSLYYDNGKYLCAFLEFGTAWGYSDIEISDVEYEGDDTYLVKYNYAEIEDADDPDSTHITTASGEMKLKGKEVDGQFFWSILSLKRMTVEEANELFIQY